MFEKGKSYRYILIILLFLVSFVVMGTVHAQSSKPSTPEFSVQQNNDTIQLVIQNQPFTQSANVNQLVYFYKAKDHNGQVWHRYGSYTLQTNNSESTLITVSPMFLRFPSENASVLDFQVQAVTGYYAVTNKSGPPALISPAPQNWHTEITFNESEYSDWSSSQTIALSETNASVTSNPTPQPSIPELQVAPVMVLILTLILAAFSLTRFKSKTKMGFT